MGVFRNQPSRHDGIDDCQSTRIGHSDTLADIGRGASSVLSQVQGVSVVDGFFA